MPLSLEVVSTRPEDGNDLADMMRQTALTEADRDFDIDSKDVDASGGFVRDGGFKDSDSEGHPDMTACDRECGYCGHWN